MSGSPRPDRGFTLIELMIVISIIVTLATVGMVQYRQSVTFAKESVLHDQLFAMRDAIDQYYADKNEYPPTLDDLVSSGYMRSLPKDPFTNSTSSWVTVPSEPDPNSSVTLPGVYDVKSGSEAIALAGEPYSNW